MTKRNNKSSLAQASPIIKRLLALGIVLVLAGLIISAVDWKLGTRVTGQVNINIVKVNGHEYITKMDVMDIIKKEAGQRVDNAQLGKINIRAIESSLEKDPYIKNADAYMDARNRLYVEIQQHAPILRIIDLKGRQYYLDEDGHFMPLSQHAVARVMVATGNIPTFYEGYMDDKEGILYKLYELTNYILNDEFLTALTEQIHITPNEDFEIVPKVGKHHIVLGDVADLDEKFRKLKIFYKEGLPYTTRGWTAYRKINLKYDKQVVGVK